MASTAHPESEPELFEEDDSLSALEDRIHRTLALVETLRAECASAIAERDAAILERDAARKAAGSTVAGSQKLRDELDSLRTERKQVRTRIEKLLGQMDLLSGQ